MNALYHLTFDDFCDWYAEAIKPRLYERDADGIPARWVEMVRHTLKSLGPKVLATRQVRCERQKS